MRQQTSLILFSYYIQMLKKSVIVLLLVCMACGTKLAINLQSYEKQCFFEILQNQQKYSLETYPRSQGTYEVEISNMVDGKWNSILYKKTQNVMESVSIHKLAPTDSTYSFCIRNIDNQKLKIVINIQSGLQLMEFEMLPDKTDSENLQRQLGWLQNQKDKLFESLERMEGLRASSEGLTNMISTKMIGFAIVGLLSIVVVNVVFYQQLKKTFKDRKLI